MFIPKKNNPFNVSDWQTAYTESQNLLLEVIHHMKAQLQKAQNEYQTALKQHETRRATWFRRQIPALSAQIDKVEQSYRSGLMQIESMAISMGIELEQEKRLSAQHKSDAKACRYMKDYWRGEALKYERLFNNLNHKKDGPEQSV